MGYFITKYSFVEEVTFKPKCYIILNFSRASSLIPTECIQCMPLQPQAPFLQVQLAMVWERATHLAQNPYAQKSLSYGQKYIG